MFFYKMIFLKYFVRKNSNYILSIFKIKFGGKLKIIYRVLFLKICYNYSYKKWKKWKEEKV